ncbi:uncharacterized protein LOC129285164 [Prosopis cineraria]|uniref:uncharacterized protein LOC129285164 n=1 Tax=Prosopis cineraria TaxID=364024 RepID=UPI0024101611|nr:uncharacterized protein LOC129285164 [Prosopis cineraria]
MVTDYFKKLYSLENDSYTPYGVSGLMLASSFFQSQWETVGFSLFSFINHIWLSGNLDSLLNRTLIASIPKIILPNVILPSQTSFIQGKNIIDSIIIAQEIMHSMRKRARKKGWMAIKVDLENAFDKLRWDFIKDTLKDVGLPSRMISAIMQCITTPTMQILCKGKPLRSFSPQRGIRQGDRCLHISSSCTIQLDRGGIPLSHLFFADDLVLFSETFAAQIAVIQRVLNQFCLSSGQKVSHDKTQIYFSKDFPTYVSNVICQLLGFHCTESLGRYLGVPLITGRVTTRTYNYIIEKLQQKLSGWKSKCLSLAGRITLAKSVLSSVPPYTTQSTMLSTSCCSDIEKIIRKFIWGYSDDHRGINLVNWKDLCQPVNRGGCGIISLEEQNKAFLSKLAYKIIAQPDLLWIRVLKAKYHVPEGSIHDISKKGCSYFWRNLTKIWQDTMKHVKWLPGNGRHIKFWSDFWVGHLGPLKFLSSDDIDEQVLKNPISDFMNSQG